MHLQINQQTTNQPNKPRQAKTIQNKERFTTPKQLPNPPRFWSRSSSCATKQQCLGTACAFNGKLMRVGTENWCLPFPKKTYPPGNDHISHLGKFGKSSSTMPFLGGYVSSLEGKVQKALQIINWLVMVSTHLKNISQIGSFPQVG